MSTSEIMEVGLKILVSLITCFCVIYAVAWVVDTLDTINTKLDRLLAEKEKKE